MKMEKVRLGIVGVGNMGSSHATKIYDGECPEIILTAIADKKPEKAEWVKEKFGENVKFFLDADEMFDSGLVDAVIIATRCLPAFHGSKGLKKSSVIFHHCQLDAVRDWI